MEDLEDRAASESSTGGRKTWRSWTNVMTFLAAVLLLMSATMLYDGLLGYDPDFAEAFFGAALFAGSGAYLIHRLRGPRPARPSEPPAPH